jgi:hypothetical protein
VLRGPLESATPGAGLLHCLGSGKREGAGSGHPTGVQPNRTPLRFALPQTRPQCRQAARARAVMTSTRCSATQSVGTRCHTRSHENPNHRRTTTTRRNRRDDRPRTRSDAATPRPRTIHQREQRRNGSSGRTHQRSRIEKGRSDAARPALRNAGLITDERRMHEQPAHIAARELDIDLEPPRRTVVRGTVPPARHVRHLIRRPRTVVGHLTHQARRQTHTTTRVRADSDMSTRRRIRRRRNRQRRHRQRSEQNNTDNRTTHHSTNPGSERTHGQPTFSRGK